MHSVISCLNTNTNKFRVRQLYTLNNVIKQVRNSTMTRSRVKSVHEDVIKPPGDKRSYRGLLLQNEMKVMLISDPTTDKSSAALQVGVGNMCDPEELPGLAHFCEHMLFLGTKKYPQEEEYKKYLSEHGGKANASTSSLFTTFFFDVAPDGLMGALDRFAQFFLCPLFTESATDREVNAVDSENEKNIKNDFRRRYSVEKETMDQSHPYTNFGTGNRTTLMDTPKEKNIDTREALLKFHKRYYSANIMTLCVLGKESLTELENMTVDLFGQVENKDVKVQHWSGNPIGPKQTKHVIKIVPVKDIRTLRIQWPIPDFHEHYKADIPGYFCHLLGHEGPGSVYSELRKIGWATSLFAGVHRYDGFGFFNVSVGLSEEGLEHTDEIVKMVYQYINMLKKEGPQEWIHQEKKEIQSIRFRFKDKEPPHCYTCNCVSDLRDYPIEETLCGGILVEEYKPEILNTLLEQLTPNNGRIIISSKTFEGKTDKTDKWYGTGYSVAPIEEIVLETWRNAGLHNNFRLHDRNDFIPESFELFDRDSNTAAAPRLIKNDDSIELWYRQDDVFLLPKAYINVFFTSPDVYSDPEAATLTSMFMLVFSDSLNEYAYAAELAGLHYDITSKRYGFEFTVFGYNDKLHVLLKKIMERMMDLEVDPERFAILKDRKVRALQNYEADQPYQHSSDFLNITLSDVKWTNEEFLKVAVDMTPEDLKMYLPRMLSKLHAKILVYGNVGQKTAEKYSQIVSDVLEKNGTMPWPRTRHEIGRTVQLVDVSWNMYSRPNVVHPTSALKVYYQCGHTDMKIISLTSLLAQIIKQPCFDTLRTKEQLGYIVFSGATCKYGVYGLYITVQSNQKTAFLETRVEAFLAFLQEHLQTMTQEVFTNHVEALSSLLLEKAKNLRQQNDRYFGEIISNHYFFDRDQQRVDCLKTLTRDDVISFYQEYIAEGAPKRRKLSIHIVSTSKIESDKQTGDEAGNEVPKSKATEIADIAAFKANLSLCPPPSPVIALNVQ